MKKLSLISLYTTLILFAGDGLSINRDESNNSNQRYTDDKDFLNKSGRNSQEIIADMEQKIKCPYPGCGGTDIKKYGKSGKKQIYKCKKCNKSFVLGTDYSIDINQRRRNANRDTHSTEGEACRYLKAIFPEGERINRKKIAETRNNKIAAYYKYLGGTYDENKKHKLQREIYLKVAQYLGFNERTVRIVLNTLLSKKLKEIKEENIEEKANKVLKEAGSDLINAIPDLKDLGFSCLRIIELIGHKEDFDSMRKNQNIDTIDNNGSRMDIAASESEHPSASEQSLADIKTSTYLGKRKRSVIDEGDESLHHKKKRKISDLAGDSLGINRDEASSSNQRYTDDENFLNEPAENSQETIKANNSDNETESSQDSLYLLASVASEQELLPVMNSDANRKASENAEIISSNTGQRTNDQVHGEDKQNP